MDITHAVRAVNRRPVFLAVTAATLAVAIAANSVTFGIVDQLLLKAPAGLHQADALRIIHFRDVPGSTSGSPVTTYTVLERLRGNVPAFAGIAGFGRRSQWSLGRGAGARGATVQMVSGNWFGVLGVQPRAGRTLLPSDDVIPEGNRVAVISYEFAGREFGNALAAVGRRLEFEGKQFEVVGVAPPGFSGVDRQRVDAWIPISAMATTVMGPGWHNTTNHWWITLVSRLRDGSSNALAESQATSIYRALLSEWKQPWRDPSASVLLSQVIPARTPSGPSREGKVALWLLAVSVVVLLIACANVANLLIARALDRRREMAVRLALGSSRVRLAGMLLLEASWLTTVAAGIALLLAVAGSRLIQRVLLPELVWNESLVSGSVFMVTLVVLTLCVLLISLAPAVHSLRIRVADELKKSGRTFAGGRGILRPVLLTAQTSLSMVLLIGAGLFVRSFNNVLEKEIGIDQDHVLRVSAPFQRFGFDAARIAEIYGLSEAAAADVPGVTAVAVAALTVPLGGASANGFAVPGMVTPRLRFGGPYNAAVSASFFRTLGAEVIRGRGFLDAEEKAGSRVVVINETLAKAFWPGANPIGQCAFVGGDSVCSTIVGVVRNILQFAILNDERAIVYAPRSHPGSGGALPSTLLVRAGGDVNRTRELLRQRLQAVVPGMPYLEVRTYRELLSPQLRPWQLGATMFTIFGGVALAIAAVGLYSVLAYFVSQRSREIGIRMALGAQRHDVIKKVAYEACWPILLGITLGGITAWVAARFLSDLLFNTSVLDWRVIVGATAALGTASLCAAIVPARRSVRVDPVEAMRAE